jgi:hypothetical protein
MSPNKEVKPEIYLSPEKKSELKCKLDFSSPDNKRYSTEKYHGGS